VLLKKYRLNIPRKKKEMEHKREDLLTKSMKRRHYAPCNTRHK
jgi:hypothetical protein